MAGKTKAVLKSCVSLIKRAMEKNKGKSNWTNIGVLITNIATLETYRSLNSVLADFHGKGLFYTFSYIASGIMCMLLAWELICLVEYKNWVKLFSCLGKIIKGTAGCFQRQTRNRKFAIIGFCLAFLFLSAVIIIMTPDTKYYASVAEVYGLPAGAGKELGRKELKNRSGYWQIKDYPYKKSMVLIYKDSYQQMEIMKQYSSAYGMMLFSAPARIEYKYETNKDKYRSYGESFYETASEHRFRELVKASYYSSGGKLIMELEKTGQDIYEIKTYEAEEMPQLFQSTLFRLPDGQTAEKGMLSQHIGITYNSNGLPQMRWLSDGIYNQYGVNGEYYTYDDKDRIAKLCYLDVNGNAVCNKLGIMTIAFQYYNNDQNVCYYSDEEGTQAVEGFYGVFCEKLSYDGQGNLKGRKQLDREWNWRHDTNGVYRYEYMYRDGALIKEEFFGVGDKPIREKRFHSNTIVFEKKRANGGQMLSVSMDVVSATAGTLESTAKSVSSFESNALEQQQDVSHGQLGQQNVQADNMEGTNELQFTDDAERGYKQQPYKNKEWANNVNNTNNMQPDEEGENFVRIYTTIGHMINNGRLEKISYYDRENKMVRNEQGYAAKQLKYDKHRRVIEESYWDADGKPCLINGGYAIVRNTYGEKGDYIAKIEYLDLDGRLVRNRELGYSFVCIERVIDDEGEKVINSYYDTGGKLIELPKLGYVKVEQQYGENGLLLRESYYDAKGAPVCRSDYRVAEISYEYADNGNLIREWYNDTQGNSANRFDTGCAVVYQKYEYGRLAEVNYEGNRDQKLMAVPHKQTGVAMIKYRYDKGQKQEERYFDAEEKPALRRDTGCAVVKYEYSDNGKRSAEYFYGTDDKLILKHDTGYAFVKYKYNASGQRTQSRYYGIDEKPVISTKYHCAGYDYQYDGIGNETDMWYIGLDGGYMVRSDLGYAYVHKEYDSSGNVLSESYTDGQNHPAVRKEYGYASYKDTYVEGKWTERRYYDTQGELTLHNTKGYAIIKIEYDEYGKCKSEHYYGTDERPVIGSEYSCAKREFKYDGIGNITDVLYFGADNKYIIRCDTGYAQVHMEYDVYGNIVFESYADADGSPVLCKDGGYAFRRSQYQDGNCSEIRYYDTEDLLTLRNDTGYAVVKMQYDGFGQKVSEDYYGIDGNPIISTKYNCAGYEYGYDEAGNQTDIWYTGLDGRHMIRDDLGYAHVRMDYDKMGKKIGESYTDTEGRPVVRKDSGYASYKDSYENGNWIEGRYYDEEGNLALRGDSGYAVIKNQYDERGQRVGEYYYGTDEQPVISTKYRCAGRMYERDERGNVTNIWYIGLDGEKMIRDDLGCAQAYYVYDIFGNEIERGYMDVDGQLASIIGDGYAVCKREYINGRIISESYYDAQGNLALNDKEGYAIIRYAYDEFGQKLEEHYYGLDNQPIISGKYDCAGRQYEYDERGNNTYIRYLGLDNKVMERGDSGSALYFSVYDGRDHLIWCGYYNSDLKPILQKDASYAIRSDRYEGTNLVERMYLGTDANPTIYDAVGCAIIKWQYNSLGQLERKVYYDCESQRINSIYGYAEIEYKYDASGNLADLIYYDVSGVQVIK